MKPNNQIAVWNAIVALVALAVSAQANPGVYYIDPGYPTSTDDSRCYNEDWEPIARQPDGSLLFGGSRCQATFNFPVVPANSINYVALKYKTTYTNGEVCGHFNFYGGFTGAAPENCYYDNQMLYVLFSPTARGGGSTTLEWYTKPCCNPPNDFLKNAYLYEIRVVATQ